MKRRVTLLACLACTLTSHAMTFVNQQPPTNGGTMRWSKLWIDPSGLGNDLDSDAICYEDFTLATDARIEHLEWWGNVDPNLGFQIEFWRQDPGTIAYQPIAVFRSIGEQPTAAFVTTNYTVGAGPGNQLHFSYDLAAPIELPKNTPANVRWFISIIGLTNQAPVIWQWSQGLGGSTRTFQWVRADTNSFRVLGEGRGLVISGTPVPEPAVALSLSLGLLYAARRRKNGSF